MEWTVSGKAGGLRRTGSDSTSELSGTSGLGCSSHSTSGRRSGTLRLWRPPPPILAIAAALAQRALTRGAQPPTAAHAAAATATAAGSDTLAAVSARQFRRQGTTVEPFDASRAAVLVTTGANAVSRNPMYVGLAGLLVANAVRLGSWLALLPVATFTLVIDRLLIAAEESALLVNFGADYEAYRATVPRWLGRRSVTRRAGLVDKSER